MKKYLSILIIFCCVITSFPITSHAKNELMQTPLSTFFNETTSANYSVSADAKPVVPVEVATQGDLTLSITHAKNISDYLLRIYTDDSYINMIHSCVLSSTKTTETISITAGGRETLYLYFTPVEPNNAVLFDFSVSATLAKAKTQVVSSKKTLQNRTWTKKKMIRSKSKHYYKLNIKKNVYINISSNNTYVSVQLLDQKKKKQLSAPVNLKSSNNFHSSFALSKGVYYIVVRSDYQTTYQLYFKQNPVATNAGATIGKATALSMNKQKLGLITATSKVESGKYYKFNLASSSRAQIVFYVENSNDRFKLQLYDEDKIELPTSNYKIGNANLLYINSKANMPAGKYYIKISKEKQDCSGCYSIMVRNQ